MEWTSELCITVAAITFAAVCSIALSIAELAIARKERSKRQPAKWPSCIRRNQQARINATRETPRRRIDDLRE